MESRSKAMETTKNYLTTAASVAASAMLARTVINEFLPSELRSLASMGIHKLFGRLSAEQTIIIRQTEGLNSNELYDAASSYLRTKISPTMKRLRASKSEDKNKVVITFDVDEEIIDIFQGAEYKWKLTSQEETQSNSRYGETSIQVRLFELKFHSKYKDVMLNNYFSHILERSKEIKAADRQLKITMNQYDEWHYSIELNHPATFGTLAMDAELKRTIMEDLARFVKRKEYYKRIGKAWKRGYLLFGPPGTGKSSLIAAMANYLRFDIYDLDLKELCSNTELKTLLVGMPNKSMLVIEDIDCSIDLRNRDEEKETKSKPEDEVTLSGILNCVDGLWSTSGEERIIVFTTNYKDRLDPALLRPGRMDMHIHMGHCGPDGFRVLASNYHCIDDHPRFEEIDELLKEVEVTPAEVSEELLRSDDVDIALRGLIQLLHKKRKESQEEKRRAEDSQDNKQRDGDSKQIEEEKQHVESETGVSDYESIEEIIGDQDWSRDV
ncbi:hypothetical protein IEQ34_004021 [Dendrobium chrysotoxum]|uniref:AAA+ ATPase domain-containing protein n=1 Tax=Dendrobium chrysotoxum TaxID=161865 RepID=A0AAV7HFG9_DENCH|nr:hypothetical protein IEQ34_004021 [Dendrobium chrysotoxum]